MAILTNRTSGLNESLQTPFVGMQSKPKSESDHDMNSTSKSSIACLHPIPLISLTSEPQAPSSYHFDVS